MGKGGGKQQVTDYFMSIHFGVCCEADELTGIYVDEKAGWEGSAIGLTPVVINQPLLNGGPTKQGGLVGTAYWLPGDPAQVMPDVLASRLGLTPDTCPAYRGLSSIFFVGAGSLSAAKGFYWTSNDPMVAQTVWARVKRSPKGLDQSIAIIEYTITKVTVSHIESDGTITTNTYLQGTDPGFQIYIGDTITTADQTIRTANASHIIYETLTNSDWGMGASTTAINVDSFNVAAETLYGEKLGLSVMWTQQATIEDFVNEMLKHIQGVVYVDPSTGKITIRLIRNDYDESTLPVYTPDNAKMTNFQKKLWGETINEIQVSWTNPLNEQQETVVAQDLANISIQGGVVSDTRDYYGARTADVAMQLAARDLRSAAAPLRSMEMEADRSSWDRVPGQCIKVTWPEYRLDEVVMRIGKIDYGRATDPAIKITLLEDVFALDQGDVVPMPGSAWVDPAAPPAPITAADIFTLPAFFTFTGLLQPGQVDVSYPEVLAAVLAYENDRETTGFQLWTPQTDPSGAAAYASVGTMTITERATLSTALPAQATSNVPTSIVTHMDRGPQVGGFAVIGAGDSAEIALVTSVDASNIGLARGVLDTVPTAWAAGTAIWFLNLSERIVDDKVIRSAGETVDYKILTQTSLGALPLADSDVYSATLDARPWLPLRPANVRVNGVGFGSVALGVATTITITWATRNRTMEEGQAVLWTDASVTPEYRQETIVTIKDVASGSTVYQQDSLWTEESLALPASDFAKYAAIDITVSSRRDDLDSLHGYTLRVTGLANDSGAPAPPSPPDPTDPPSPIAAPGSGAWTVTGTSISDGAGDQTPALKVTGTPDLASAEGLVISYKKHSDTAWSTWPMVALTDANVTVFITSVAGNTSYDVDLAYVTNYGDAGAILSTPQSYGPVTTDPLVVSAGTQPFGFAYNRANAATITPGSTLVRFDLGVAWSMPSGLANARGDVDVAPGANTDFDIQIGGVSIGTMRFAAGSTTATFIMGSTHSVASGVPTTVVAPSNLNGMSGLLNFSIIGTR